MLAFSAFNAEKHVHPSTLLKNIKIKYFVDGECPLVKTK
jgi:hypothetical protein